MRIGIGLAALSTRLRALALALARRAAEIVGTPPELIADIERYPGLGSMELRHSDGQWRHWCGMVLVAPTVGITTAHCVTLPHLPESVEFRARFGSAKRETGGIVRGVGEIRPHPTFVYGRAGGIDLAVIVLSESVPITPTTIIAPDPSAPIDLLGWGGLTRGLPFVWMLKRLQAEILPADECPTGHMEAWEICTATRGYAVTTGGDSGTPGSQRLPGTDIRGTVGLLSRGVRERKGVDIYTAVHHHREWIFAEVAEVEAEGETGCVA